MIISQTKVTVQLLASRSIQQSVLLIRGKEHRRGKRAYPAPQCNAFLPTVSRSAYCRHLFFALNVVSNERARASSLSQGSQGSSALETLGQAPSLVDFLKPFAFSVKTVFLLESGIHLFSQSSFLCSSEAILFQSDIPCSMAFQR